MLKLLREIKKLGIDKVRFMAPNTLQINKERGCLIISKGGGDDYTIVSVLEGKTKEEVLKFIEEYK